jgi:hypothetical protein
MIFLHGSTGIQAREGWVLEWRLEPVLTVRTPIFRAADSIELATLGYRMMELYTRKVPASYCRKSYLSPAKGLKNLDLVDFLNKGSRGKLFGMK